MKHLIAYLFIVIGLGLELNSYANSQSDERKIGVNIPSLAGSVVTVNYGKYTGWGSVSEPKVIGSISYRASYDRDEKFKLNYNKSCKPLEIKLNDKIQKKNFECRWFQSDLNFRIKTRIGKFSERVFSGHFSSLEESNMILKGSNDLFKKWPNIYKIKKGKWDSKSFGNGRLDGAIEFNLDEVAKVNPLDINDKNLEEERRKIEEEKKKIEDEKRKIAEAKKKKEKDKKGKKQNQEELFVIGSGSGFFVSSNGYAVSNDHVVGICRKVASKIKGKIIYFDIISTDQKNDLGLLKSSHKNKEFLNIKISGAEFGEDIVAFGFPLSDALSSSIKLTRGIVSALSGPENNFSEIQIDAAIQPGNSGGPVINMQGQVVGVASSGLNKLYMLEKTEYIPENVNFAVAAPTLTNFLRANGVSVSNKSLRIKNTKDLAKIGRPSTLQLFCMNTKAVYEKLKKQKKHSDVLLEKVVELK